MNKLNYFLDFYCGFMLSVAYFALVVSYLEQSTVLAAAIAVTCVMVIVLQQFKAK